MSAVLVGLGARLWNADGLTATVTEVGAAGLFGVVDGGRDVVRLWATDWRAAMECEYCDHPAELATHPDRGGAALLCRSCAHTAAAGPAAWATPIPKMLIREVYGQCTRLA